MEPKFTYTDQVSLVKAWMDQTGEKPPLDQELADALERWIRADKWLRKYFSVSQVWSMMIVQYGYSDLAARRDVSDAQHYFSITAKQKGSYWAALVLDRLGQAMIDAVADRKWADMAKIAREIREYMKFIEEVDQVDPKDLIKPVPRRIAFQPEILNVQHDPKAREKVLALVREITGEDPVMGSHAESSSEAQPVTDVSYVAPSRPEQPKTTGGGSTYSHLDDEIRMITRTTTSSRSGTPFQIPRSRSS